MMQGWYYVESLTGQRHDRVQTESQIATVDSWFDLVGSLQHGVESYEIFSWSTDVHKPTICRWWWPQMKLKSKSKSWIRTNSLLMSDIPQEKSDKTRESPTYWGLKELPIWWWSPTKAPHIPGWGESGFTLTGALPNFMFIPQELNEKGNSVDLSIRPK